MNKLISRFKKTSNEISNLLLDDYNAEFQQSFQAYENPAYVPTSDESKQITPRLDRPVVQLDLTTLSASFISSSVKHEAANSGKCPPVQCNKTKFESNRASNDMCCETSAATSSVDISRQYSQTPKQCANHAATNKNMYPCTKKENIDVLTALRRRTNTKENTEMDFEISSMESGYTKCDITEDLTWDAYLPPLQLRWSDVIIKQIMDIVEKDNELFVQHLRYLSRQQDLRPINILQRLCWFDEDSDTVQTLVGVFEYEI